MTATEELLPCPFCGGKADLFSVPSPAERGQVAHRVICRSPHCAALGYFKTEEGAIKAWNTRSITAAAVYGYQAAQCTCEVEGYDDGVDEGMDGEWYSYGPPTWHLSCGHETYGSERPCYCSTCGRKVEQ